MAALNVPRLLPAAVVCMPLVLLLGTLSGRYAGAASAGPWFDGLAKPDFYPPAAAFGIVWSLLYLLMGLALALVLSTPGRKALEVTLFVLQLATNLAWAPLFFRSHRLGWSVALIMLILVLAAATAWAFWRVRRVAGLAMLPYLLWLAFAGVLAARVWTLNPGGSRFVENPTIVVPLAQE